MDAGSISSVSVLAEAKGWFSSMFFTLGIDEARAWVYFMNSSGHAWDNPVLLSMLAGRRSGCNKSPPGTCNDVDRYSVKYHSYIQ